MNKRLFTFGCSFTNYWWPTWADILGQSFDKHYNWGIASASNQYILNSLLECHAKQTITENDTVIIMWTFTDRESKINNAKWQHEMRQMRSDDSGYNMLTMYHMLAAKNTLDGLGCKYQFFTLQSIHFAYDTNATHMIGSIDSLLTVPSFKKLIYNNVWETRKDDLVNHSSVFTRTNALSRLQIAYEDVAGESWPSFDQFISDPQNIPASVLNEIKEMQFDKWLHRILQTQNNLDGQLDFHATPLMHYEFLEKTGLFDLTEQQYRYAQAYNEKVKSYTTLNFNPASKHIQRFGY